MSVLVGLLIEASGLHTCNRSSRFSQIPLQTDDRWYADIDESISRLLNHKISTCLPVPEVSVRQMFQYNRQIQPESVLFPPLLFCFFIASPTLNNQQAAVVVVVLFGVTNGRVLWQGYGRGAASIKSRLLLLEISKPGPPSTEMKFKDKSLASSSPALYKPGRRLLLMLPKDWATRS
ncbi:unnamed protein product [Lactuca virosa]|uniref:Uncharacterized protein n=1 Tax=Lactuca virosa TaxID=75947 RepID=A0AAU9NPP9_9ASTR|nr:unnamed protein product [Lactuca virosa]